MRHFLFPADYLEFRGSRHLSSLRLYLALPDAVADALVALRGSAPAHGHPSREVAASGCWTPRALELELRLGRGAGRERTEALLLHGIPELPASEVVTRGDVVELLDGASLERWLGDDANILADDGRGGQRWTALSSVRVKLLADGVEWEGHGDFEWYATPVVAWECIPDSAAHRAALERQRMLDERRAQLLYLTRAATSVDEAVLELGHGWRPLIERGSDLLLAAGIRPAQIGRARGVLHFDVGPRARLAASTRARLEEIEAESRGVCQLCGHPGERRFLEGAGELMSAEEERQGAGFIVLCDAHDDGRLAGGRAPRAMIEEAVPLLQMELL